MKIKKSYYIFHIKLNGCQYLMPYVCGLASWMATKSKKGDQIEG
jgi:hypothetical protein